MLVRKLSCFGIGKKWIIDTHPRNKKGSSLGLKCVLVLLFCQNQIGLMERVVGLYWSGTYLIK